MSIYHTSNYYSDNIESNITSVAIDTGAAATELTEAHEYQRKAGRRAACLMIVLALVICVVLLAVRAFFLFPRHESLTNLIFLGTFVVVLRQMEIEFSHAGVYVIT